MKEIHLFCDACGCEMPKGTIFDSLTISQEIGGVTTWEMCANCSRAIAIQMEKDCAITRDRWNEQFMAKLKEEVG